MYVNMHTHSMNMFILFLYQQSVEVKTSALLLRSLQSWWSVQLCPSWRAPWIRFTRWDRSLGFLKGLHIMIYIYIYIYIHNPWRLFIVWTILNNSHMYRCVNKAVEGHTLHLRWYVYMCIYIYICIYVCVCVSIFITDTFVYIHTYCIQYTRR